MVVRYDRAYRCVGGPTPGAIALRDHWRKVTGLGDMGVYVCRQSTGGGGYSVHAAGRAVDHAANYFNASQRAKAENYIQFLIANSERLQVQMIIWNRRDWKSGVGWTSYGGPHPHQDHIHSELNLDGGRIVNMQLLDSLWASWNRNPEEFHLSTEQYNDIKARLARIEAKVNEIEVEETKRFTSTMGSLNAISGYTDGLVSTIRSSGNNVANAFRRIMGVPVTDDRVKQAENDKATGTKVQNHFR